jgi:hypothetical protein
LLASGVVDFVLNVFVQVSLPKPGNYMLCLYARSEQSEEKSLPNVFNYLLQYMPEADSEDASQGKDPARKSSASIFKKNFFSKKDKTKDKEKDKSKDKFSDRSSDKSSDKSV